MNFDDLNHDDLDEYMMERLVLGADEMSPILRGHLLVEKVLETLIARHLAAPHILFKRRISFDMKVALAQSMGLLDPKRAAAFKALNRIRNNYAHREDYQVSLSDLTALRFDWEPVQVEAYAAACAEGIADAAQIATIFLCWQALALIKEPS